MADTNVRPRGSQAPGSQNERAFEASEQAKRENERQEGPQAAGAVGDRAQQATRDAMASAQEGLQRGAEVARRGMENVVSNLAEQTHRTTDSIKEAMEVHQNTVRSAAADFRAAASAATESAEGVVKIDTAMVDLVGQSAEATARVSQRLLGSRTFREAADAQRDYSETLMKNWIEGSALILRATQEIAERALAPINERAEQRIRA